MPRQSPVPNDLDRPFYDAANDDRLVLQYCTDCDRFQYPPEPSCFACGEPANLTWRPVSGAGTIYSSGIVHDTPVSSLKPDLPYICAVINLDDAPGVNMVSLLPGTPVGDVPIGALVELIFVSTPATGQKVPEWRLGNA
jgi:hypothetical protein